MVEKWQLKGPSPDTIYLDLGFTDAYTDYQVVETDSSSLLIGINPKDFALDILDLKRKSSSKKIIFQHEGPDGILGNIDGFYYHNSDSIFILSIDSNTVYLMNENSELQKKIQFNNNTLPDGFNNYDVYANQGMQNGPFYLPARKSLELYTYRWLPPNEDDFSYTAFASYSLKEQRFTHQYGKYPSNYGLNTNYLLYNDPSLTIVDSLAFVQLGANPSIACYSTNSGELLYHGKLTCEHWDKEPSPLKSLTNEFQIEQDWLVENPAYIYLLADRKNKLLFRLLKHKQPLLNNQGVRNPRWYGTWCVTIYDYDLNIVGHHELKANTYLPLISFIANGQLWIKNPSADFKENESLFYKFKIEEITLNKHIP
ncbi:DUF4221 family protein [Roseivirga pacifica]|uniref:DUF4221 family protein n=1 Tax=Roseivirga pacifica TaxID=1267423 RepID=UPI00227AA7D4|nr:DUF4221 family protein [Roseivirga pacifica]